MLSSRSDSVIHDMAHSSESRIAAQQMSGHALDVPMSIQITPVSSGIESMFESRASRDHRLRGRTRSGEGSGIFLEPQLEDGSLRRMRRQSGSHTRLTRRSLSRSPSSREDNEPLQELVEVEIHGALSRERTAGSPTRSASFHGSSEPKREAQCLSSSSIAANAMSPRSLLKDSHSSRLVQDARTSTSTERTSSTLGTTGNRGALTSSFKTDFESSKRLGSLLDKGRTSPTRLGVTSGVESMAQRQEHDVLATSRNNFSGALGLSSSGFATKTTTESTQVRSQQQTGTAAIRETAPLAVGQLEFRNVTQAAKAEERQKPQIVITTERNTTQGPGWSQQTVSSRWKVQETASGSASSETRPDTLAATDTKSGMLISSSKQGSDHKKFFSNATASSMPDSSEKTSLMTPSFLQKETSSKSLLEQSVHRSSLFSDNAPETLTNSAPAPVVAPNSLEKEGFSKSMTQQSLFKTGISSGMDSDTSAVNAAQRETVAKQETIQQAVIENTAAGTLIHSEGNAASLTPTSVLEKTSKSFIQESIHRTGIPSNKITSTSTVSDATGNTLSDSTYQDSFQNKHLDRPALTMLGSSEKSSFFTSSAPAKTSSRTVTQESIRQSTASLDKAAGAMAPTAIEGTTLSTSTNQAALHQDVFDKSTAPAMLDLHERSSALTSGILEKRTSSKNVLQESVKNPELLSTKAATVTSEGSNENANLFTSSFPKASSKLVIHESVHRTISSHKAPGISTNDVKAVESTAASENENAILHTTLDKTAAPTLLDLHEKTSILSPTFFQKASSGTSVRTSSERVSIPSDRAPETARVTDSTGDLLTISTKQGACERVLGNAAAPAVTSSTEDVSRVVQGTASKYLLEDSQLRTSLPSEGQAVGATVPALEDVKLSSTKQDTLTNLSGATLVTSAPERTSSNSVIQEPMLQTISSTKPPDVLVSADTKDDTFSSSAVQDLVQQKPAETESNNYSLSAGTHLITTKKVSTRHKTNEPVQQSFFERIEGSKYQTFDSALQRGQLASSSGKYDFQEFQVTASSEPTQATVEIACERESLPAKAPQDLSTEYVSADKEKKVGEKAESTTAVALTPLPELSLIGSSPKASSEEIRSSETERSVSKVADRDDALQWLVTTERHSTRLGEAAALFEAPSDVVQTGHRRSRVEFSESKQMIEQVRQAENHESGYEGVSRWKVYETAMQEDTAPAPVSESLIKPQTAPIMYDTEQDERVSQSTNNQPHVDSSLLHYTPDEYILAELVREVEKKIEASSRYHVEPLPDDVLTIRSSKGIESLGQLRYETYEEELLMRRSEDDLSQEQKREYPCSASTEEAPTRIHSGSPDTSATDLASRKEEERRLADIKVQQEKDKAMPQLVRSKSIAELIEQIIQQHVSGTDIRKQGIVHEKEVQAQDFTSAQAPGFPPNMGQQEIPVYYQTGTASQKLGDQYVNDYRFSLLGVPRKSDTQLESTSQAERRFSFSSLGGRGAKCVIRKLEPGALTYLVEVSPADKNQENQTDMVMAEEQMLVSEIFDHITTPNLRLSSSGTRLNEPEPITVSSAASLTAIRNAYAEAVARRVLCKQLPQGTEGVLSAAQKAKFYENRQGMNVEKTASSTSLHSAASVEDYVVQRMIDSGIIRNQAELWGKKPLNFENRIISRTCSAGTFSKSGASSEALAAPPSTPSNNVEPGEEGAEYCADTAQDSTAQAPEKEEVPRGAEFEPARDMTAATSNFVESEKQAMAAATSAESYEEKRSSTFASNERSAREYKSTATVKATVTSEGQRSVAKQPSAASLKSTVSIGSGECTLCTNHITPEKSFESFICFGLHDLPKYFATVPTEVSDTIKLRIATDDDVREIMYLPWNEPESTYTLHAAIVTRHMLCPSSFFVAVDTSRGVICGAASALMFDEEVAFCGFCHILKNYAFEHVGVLLWNELLHVTSGKNLFTLLPEPAYRELQEVYPFPSNPATGILFGPARLSLAAFARTVLVLEYKDKYFDALASYDKHVFGFNRKRYLAATVHEVGLDIRVATRNERNICGYGGMQRDSRGRLVLRWLFADDAATAESLLSSLLSSCTNEDEVEVVAAFFLRSASTRPILDKFSTRQLEPWRLVYTKREPLHSYGRVVCLTTV
ncbi:hypothetical protein HPB49_018141 [Dermacentor silvarum]|uniref:Uncharacterized protein n=1 Tax=Dermacentor silvarum TaxID=543639 RepID=A0ACB8DF14_DERSI|nr:hypothetical protein HPB49_018141 [Dermacentor silvarum]